MAGIEDIFADVFRTLIIAGGGFSIVSILGLVRVVLPLQAIDRWRVRLLCSLVNLGMGVDDEAVERLRRVPNAERILEDMIEKRGSQNHKFAQPRRCSSPAMVLEMMRSRGKHAGL